MPISGFCFDIGPRLSTLGAGIEANIYDFGPVTLRANFNYFKLKFTLKKGDLDFGKPTIRFRTVGLYADVKPLSSCSNFRITGGLLHNKNRINGTAKPTKGTKVRNKFFTAQELGTVTANATFNKISPYLGIGYSIIKSPATIIFDAGVLFQGKPKIAFQSTGLVQNSPNDVNYIKEDIQKRMNKGYIRCYPVVGLSILF